MSSKISDHGSMKRSFSDMQKKESAERFSCALPVAFRDGYFIAIREKSEFDATDTSILSTTARKEPSMYHNDYQSCCVFGCWNDAQIFLERMEMEGRNIEYDAFEKLDDATQFAFRNNSTSTNEQGLLHREKVELQPSHLSEDALSGLEKLPQDALTNVYRYLCPGSLPLKVVNRKLSMIGMLSKNLYETCAKYVQQEPLCLDNEYDPKILSFYLRNKVKLRAFLDMKGTGCSVFKIITLMKLKFSDLSRVTSLDIDLTKYENFGVGGKWSLVEDGFVSIDYVKRYDQIRADPFIRECAKLIVTSGVPSLKKITMRISIASLEIYWSVFVCAIKRLEELSFWLEHDAKIAMKRIEHIVCIAPQLKKLSVLAYDNEFRYDFKIRSKSLEYLNFLSDYNATTPSGPVLQGCDINCPSLIALDLKIDLYSFDPNQFIRSKSFQSIKTLRLVVDTSRDAPISHDSGRKISEMLCQMPSLKDLHLTFICEIPNDMITLPSIERLWIRYEISKNICFRGASLKLLHLMYLHDLFELKDLHFDLGSVEDLLIEVSFCDDPEDEMRLPRILDDLSATIEERMPKLKRFKLGLDNDYYNLEDYVFIIRSQSLEKIDVDINVFSDFQFDCPLLKALNGTERRWVEDNPPTTNVRLAYKPLSTNVRQRRVF